MIIILLTTSTLFHLHQYLTVPLPVGFIEPTEALLSVMLVSVWLKRSGNVCTVRDPSRARRMCAIILPYCAWQTFCIILGLSHSAAGDFRFMIRALLSAVLPWVSLYILAKLSPEEGQEVFSAMYYLMLGTACIHLLLQVTDYRPAMTAAYWFIPANTEYDLSWVKQSIDGDAFFRGLPQGIDCIIFFTLIKLSDYVFGQERRSTFASTASAIVLFCALFITVTRSFVVILAAGTIILVGLALLTFQAKIGHAIKIGGILCFFVSAALVYNAVRPGFLEFWSQRINEFSGADSQIFSAENKARGLDNIAAMNAIRDYPLLGVGMARIPIEYSLRDGPPTDTHPMLEIGLIGGIPAIILVVLLQTRLFWLPLSAAFRNTAVARESIPLISVIIMNAFVLNMAGGGGTLFGPSILYVTIFSNELCNRIPPALERPAGRYVKRRMETRGAIGTAPHFSHNPVL